MDRTASDAIIIKAAAGDRDAAQALLRLTAPTVNFVCSFLLNDPAEAASAVDAVLEKIRRNLGSLRSAEAFPGWVSRITARHCMGILKKSRPELFVTGTHEQDLPAAVLPHEDHRVPPNEEDTEAHAKEALLCLHRLPAQHRVCAFLFYFSALSLREIGGLMDTSEAAAVFRLESARKALRAHTRTEYLGWYLSRCADAGITVMPPQTPAAPEAEVPPIPDAGAPFPPEPVIPEPTEEELFREFPDFSAAPPESASPKSSGAVWLYLILMLLLAAVVGFFASVIRSGALADKDFWEFARATSAAVLPWLQIYS